MLKSLKQNKIIQNYIKSIDKVSQKYWKSILKVTLKYPHSIHKISKKYAKCKCAAADSPDQEG